MDSVFTMVVFMLQWEDMCLKFFIVKKELDLLGHSGIRSREEKVEIRGR